jgi:hypothetical protein
MVMAGKIVSRLGIETENASRSLPESGVTEKMTVIVPVSEAVLDWLVSKTIWPRRNAPPDDVEQLVSGAAQRSSREETQARAKIRGAGRRGERV